jgi:exodeoxyribonuclease VII large subunit
MSFEIRVQKLKAKRKEIGTREGKELFMILSNATIDAMASSMPKNKAELIQVKGWGEKKIQMYGNEFLNVLNNNGEETDVEDKTQVPEETGPKKIKIQIGQESLNLFDVKKELKKVVEEEESIDIGIKEVNDVLSVSEFLGTLNKTLSTLGEVKIKGEMDDVQVRNGYAFFELKDSLGGFEAEASMGCFVGWKCFSEVKHLLESGFEVVVSGIPKIYLKNGSFRLEVTNIEAVGEGALQKAFEALQRKLQEKGYFDLSRKRPLPENIRKIGLITSTTGAVIVDFKKNLGSQGLQVFFLDVRVEGDQAEDSIVQALRKFNEQRDPVDVLVLIRGGGSLQSLKAFNSEKVADAIFYSRIPVITGIGHDKDETIAGFTSDLNCSTPTAVANFLHSKYNELEQILVTHTKNIFLKIEYKIRETKISLEHETNNLFFTSEKMFRRVETKMNFMYENLKFGLQNIFITFHRLEKNFSQVVFLFTESFREKSYTLNLISEKIQNISEKNFRMLNQNIVLLAEKLKTLNPEAILKRGYSITYDENGKILRDVEKIKIEQTISVRLSSGKISAEVKKIDT